MFQRKKDKIDIRMLRDMQAQNIQDDYSCGLHNGLELALAVLECREPVFRTFEKEPDIIEVEEEKPGRTAYSGVRRRVSK